MKFATLEGKLVQSGGMVVKNVAGLDMGKLLIGSFGTLAAIATVNFKLIPRPAASAHAAVCIRRSVGTAIAARDAALRGVLNPVAVDLLNPVLAAQITRAIQSEGLHSRFDVRREPGRDRTLASRSCGVRNRARTALSKKSSASGLRFSDHPALPRKISRRRRVPESPRRSPNVSDALSRLKGRRTRTPASGIVRGWFTPPDSAVALASAELKRGWKGVIEFSAEPCEPANSRSGRNPAATLRS